MDRVERATGPPYDSLPLLIGWMKRMLPRDSEGEFRRQGDSPCCLCVSCLSSRHPPRFINLCRAGPLWQVGTTSTRRAEGLSQRLRFFTADPCTAGSSREPRRPDGKTLSLMSTLHLYPFGRRWTSYSESVRYINQFCLLSRKGQFLNFFF